MKKVFLFSFVFLLGFLSSCVPPQQEPTPDEGYIDNQEFYDALSPYGHWIQRPNGDYVWIPEAGPDFVPYSNGYWVWADAYGWTWVSNYPWGWAPFHYGRWDYDDGYGWYWIPDNVWGPAWVSWREYPGYYGWCPLRPGISIDIALSGGYDPDERWWTVCDGRYFGHPDMRDHYEHHGDHVGRIRGGESRVIGNAPNVGGGRRGFVTGPDKGRVEAITHSPIQAVKIAHSNRPGESLQGNTLNVYRPQVQRVSTPRVQQTQPAQNNQAPHSQPAQNPSGARTNQSVPRSVTTPQDIRDLHNQANPPQQHAAPPPHEAPRQSAPAPRQQAAPRQQPAPRQAPPQRAPQQAAPRNNGESHGGGGGRPK